MRIVIDNRRLELELKKVGKTEVLSMPIETEVERGSFLHIGASPSPLTEKKGAVFKVDRTPVIPASSLKGALRYQLELLFIEKADEFDSLLKPSKKVFLSPCIPSPRPSSAERELITSGKYRQYCEIRVEEKKVVVAGDTICPVCYFMGSGGIMGFLRIGNSYPTSEGNIVDYTNIRIDRHSGTAAGKAKVDIEHVKSGVRFRGVMEVVMSTPQGFEFGEPRKIGDMVIDKWLENWKNDSKKEFLLEQVLIPALENIAELGGYKSKGAGKVNLRVSPSLS
jgi:CRISPR/Cas system CSM-associated protein Csm3 (group 7 of RAMP superfamily)